MSPIRERGRLAFDMALQVFLFIKYAVEKLTDSSRLDHVADGKSFDCLIFGSASRAIRASDGLDVPTALLISPAAYCC